MSDVEEKEDSRYRVPITKQKIEYISDMLLELKKMADASNLTALASILEVARSEAALRIRDYD